MKKLLLLMTCLLSTLVACNPNSGPQIKHYSDEAVDELKSRLNGRREIIKEIETIKISLENHTDHQECDALIYILRRANEADVRDFFYNKCQDLCKKVTDFSERSIGRLAGAALWYDGLEVKVVHGRKASTLDQSQHIERVLIDKLFGNLTVKRSGYLFVYTPLPPCHETTSGCLSYYTDQLASNHPHLKTMVIFQDRTQAINDNRTQAINHREHNSDNLVFVNIPDEKDYAEKKKKIFEKRKKLKEAQVKCEDNKEALKKLNEAMKLNKEEECNNYQTYMKNLRGSKQLKSRKKDKFSSGNHKRSK